MTETLIVSINRASMGGAPELVLYGHGNLPGLAVEGYTEPAMRPRTTYAPDSDWVNGSMPLSMVWQESILGFTVFADAAASEAEARSWIADLVQALGRLRYPVTVTVGDAAPETWVCGPGTVAPAGGRSRADLQDHNNVWEVTIPCQPIRSTP